MYLFAIISDVKCTNYDISGNHPANKEIRQIYKICGFDKLLNNEEFSYNRDKANTLLLIRGNKVKSKIAKEICKFLTEKIGINTVKFYGAFVELMTNTVQHAYYDCEERQLEGKWQVFVRYLDNKVKFVFLDTGKGIPSTVRKNKSEKLLEIFTPFIKSIDEGDILKSAFEGKFRTRTEEENRGKGLPQIYELFKSENIDNVFVYSGKSNCIIKKNAEDSYFSCDDEFYGTLYEFDFKGV